MDMPDLDEEEKARRKKEAVEYRNKKHISAIFMILMSIFEIVETVLIMVLMFVLMSVLLIKVFNFDMNAAFGQITFQAMCILIFMSSMILGFLIYKKFAKFIIKKFNLEQKLSEDVIAHYKPRDKIKEKEKLKR